MSTLRTRNAKSVTHWHTLTGDVNKVLCGRKNEKCVFGEKKKKKAGRLRLSALKLKQYTDRKVFRIVFKK